MHIADILTCNVFGEFCGHSIKRAQPPEPTVTACAHFAWFALVAIRTAQQNGQTLSPLSTHAFLLCWLTVAYKQKRFSRAIASDIESLMVLGRQKGPAAGLFLCLEYLCAQDRCLLSRICTG